MSLFCLSRMQRYNIKLIASAAAGDTKLHMSPTKKTLKKVAANFKDEAASSSLLKDKYLFFCGCGEFLFPDQLVYASC